MQESNKPIARVTRDLGINEGTLANWVNREIERRLPSNGGVSASQRAELLRLRRENAELAMERDVLKCSVVLWVKEGMKQLWPPSSVPRGSSTVCRTR